MAIVANREEILTVAKRLWDHQSEINRDEVDGTFYWTFCRPDFMEDRGVLAELRAKANTLANSFTPDRAEELRALVKSIGEIETRWRTENPSLPLGESLVLPDWLPLRGAFFSQSNYDDPIRRNTARLLILNPYWDGKRVESEFLARVRPEFAYRFWRNEYPERWLFGAQIRFAIVESGNVLEGVWNDQSIMGGPIRIPVQGLIVETMLPLPPQGVIEAVFDQAISTEPLQGEFAPGKGGQGVGTAIKSWAVALLMASGDFIVRPDEGKAIELADEAVSLALGGEWVREASNISRSIRELKKRVPESVAFLMPAKMPRNRRKVSNARHSKSES